MAIHSYLDRSAAWIDSPERKRIREAATRFIKEGAPTDKQAEWEGHAIWREWRTVGKKGTWLHTVCENQLHEPSPAPLLDFLLRQGLSLNQPNNTGCTPLMRAVAGPLPNRMPWAKAMLEAGADPTLVQEDGRSVLSYAITGGTVDMVAFLLEKGAVLTAADRAAFHHLNNTELLAYFWPTFGVPDTEGERTDFFIKACQDGRWKAVESIIPYGVDLQATRHGKNAIMWAVQRSKIPVALVEYFASQGVDVRAHVNGGNADDQGKSVMDLARAAAVSRKPLRQQKRLESVQTALARGAEKNMDRILPPETEQLEMAPIKRPRF